MFTAGVDVVFVTQHKLAVSAASSRSRHLLADLRTNNRQLGKVRVKVKYRLVYNLYCGVTQISPLVRV